VDDDIGDEEEADCSEYEWLTTYGDAMTLLLTFFVLLLSMSTINPQTFHVVISSFQGAVGVLEGGKTMTPADMMNMGINVHEMSEARTTVTQQIPQETQNELQTQIENATVRKDERGLVIQITDRFLFEPGQISLTQQGRRQLRNIARLLQHPDLRERQIRVEGHTDDVAPSDFASNWQISVLRASRVVEQLDNSDPAVSPNRMSAVGFGATRPIASNETEEGRGQNRRVEIVLLRDEVQNGE
jgi:chemotaxis protein MotB